MVQVIIGATFAGVLRFVNRNLCLGNIDRFDDRNPVSCFRIPARHFQVAAEFAELALFIDCGGGKGLLFLALFGLSFDRVEGLPPLMSAELAG